MCTYCSMNLSWHESMLSSLLQSHHALHKMACLWLWRQVYTFRCFSNICLLTQNEMMWTAGIQMKWVCDHRSESQFKQLRKSPKKRILELQRFGHRFGSIALGFWEKTNANMQFFLGGVLWISFVLVASHLTKDIQKTPPRKKCVFACLFFSKTMRKPAGKK